MLAFQRQPPHHRIMTKRATQRPAEFKKPAHWTDNPAPKPGEGSRHEDAERPDPTRYGDWEKNGIAIDF